ncbi:MAG: hypothetical protein ACAH80_04155 [Alphaproteobacteria bacterium]
MTAIAALKTQEIDTTEEVSADGSLMMSRFSDELFSAVKHGNAVKVRELLDIDDTTEDPSGPGFVNLMEAVHEKEEDEYMGQLIEIASESGDYDLSMAALLLVASGGNPESAREMLKNITEGRDDGGASEAAAERAMSKGNMNAAMLIKQRMRAMEFNAKASSEAQKESLYEKCMNFFSGKSRCEEAKENSRFTAAMQKGLEQDIEFLDKLPPQEKATMTARMIKGLTSLMSWNTK